MKTTKVKIRRVKKDSDEGQGNMLELYTMVPPSPLVLKRIRSKKIILPPKK